MKNFPIKIGITGGIGSGKTTLSNILKNMGFPVYNTDKAVAEKYPISINEEFCIFFRGRISFEIFDYLFQHSAYFQVVFEVLLP